MDHHLFNTSLRVLLWRFALEFSAAAALMASWILSCWTLVLRACLSSLTSGAPPCDLWNLTCGHREFSWDFFLCLKVEALWRLVWPRWLYTQSKKVSAGPFILLYLRGSMQVAWEQELKRCVHKANWTYFIGMCIIMRCCQQRFQTKSLSKHKNSAEASSHS